MSSFGCLTLPLPPSVLPSHPRDGDSFDYVETIIEKEGEHEELHTEKDSRLESTYLDK